MPKSNSNVVGDNHRVLLKCFVQPRVMAWKWRTLLILVYLKWPKGSGCHVMICQLLCMCCVVLSSCRACFHSCKNLIARLIATLGISQAPSHSFPFLCRCIIYVVMRKRCFLSSWNCASMVNSTVGSKRGIMSFNKPLSNQNVEIVFYSLITMGAQLRALHSFCLEIKSSKKSIPHGSPSK